MKLSYLTYTLLALGLTGSLCATEEAKPQPQTPAQAALPAFQPDPAIVAKLNGLEAGTFMALGKFKIEPADVSKYHGALKDGPGRRDYGNKMVYAPDRGTALYCGANHGSPHRLNDVWEFHLSSNTWRMICPPGNDATRLRGYTNEERKLTDLIAKGTDVEKNKAELEKIQALIKTWYEGVELKDGYLQDKVNGGPVQPWHTWDGLTYDEKTKRLCWAVLDSDNYKEEKQRVHRNLIRTYAKYSGQDGEKLLEQWKPGTSMYMYDLAKGRWTKQLGEGPYPIMRGMGGSLNYFPDKDVTVWYACVGNTPGGYDEGMWAYDAKTNKWTNLLIGSAVRDLVYKTKVAPAEELQMAYSASLKKLVAVQKEKTFVYDAVANAWTRATDNPLFGIDNRSVFSYDSNANAFLLLGKPGNEWSKEPWFIAAYDPGTDKWEKLELKGDPIPQDTANYPQAFTGYYDTAQNVFVIYNGRNASTYVYRHKAKAAAKP